MKKLRYIFSFLNKKGVFFFGLLMGLLLAFFTCLRVSAENLDYQALGFQHTSSMDYTFYAIYDFSLSNTAGYKMGDGAHLIITASNPVIRVERSDGSYQDFSQSSADIFNNDSSDGSYSNIFCYVFADYESCMKYLSGEIDASSALNYEEVQNNNMIYDSSIPSLDYLKYDTITDKGFIANFGFNNSDTFTNYAEFINSDIMYDIQVVHFYSEYEGLSRFEQLMAKGVSNVNKWVANNFGSGNSIDDEIALSKVQAVYDSNGLIKTDLCPTVDSYNKNNNNGLLLFTVTVNGSDVLSVTNSVTYKVEPFDNLVYVGSQTCVTPYVIRDGQKHYGNSIYYQGFNTTGYQEYYGTPSNIIGTFDELGDYTTINSNNASSIGNSTVSLTSDNLLDYIHTGFGLSGSGGYIELMQAFFLGVPAWFWVLVSTALATNLVLLAVKVIRGM